ncbi:MAG: hypothetical protein ACRDO2_00135 [Nocardioidaceae bacterium]
MTARTPSDETVVAAMCAALAPYPWRRFTPELLARFALAVSDRHGLEEGLLTVQGAAVGRWDRLMPVERDDPRVPRLVEFLTSHRWTELSLPALCRSLFGVLGSESR